MIAGRPSRTAERVAIRRATHQLLDRPLVLEDPLALPILGEPLASELRADPRRFERGPLASYLRAFMAVRSRVAEDTLACAVADGVSQYVVLGAGLDTFAYRNPHLGVRVVEVDHPATQVWKHKRLAEAGIAVPPDVGFAAVDLGVEPLADALIGAGVRPGEPAVFAWLGVAPYLEAADVFATLRAMAPFATGGGAVIFDYSVPAHLLSMTHRFALKRLSARVEAAGEPFRSFFEPDRLVAAIHELGYRHVHDLPEAELNATYLSGRSDRLRVGSAAHIVVAR